MKKFIKIAVDEAEEIMAVHIAADPVTLRELQNIILIEAHKKEIPYVHQTSET